MTAVVGALVGFFRTRGLLAIPLIVAFFAVDGRAREHGRRNHPADPGAARARCRTGDRSHRRGGDERRRGDGRHRLRADQPVSGRHRAEAGAAASVWPEGCLRLVDVRSWPSAHGSRTRCAYAARTRTAPAVRIRSRCAPRWTARHLVDARCDARRRWRSTSTARCGWTGASTSCPRRSSSARSSPAWSAALGLADSMATYLDGMQALVPAAVMVGLARSISLVLPTAASSTRSSTGCHRRWRVCRRVRPRF